MAKVQVQGGTMPLIGNRRLQMLNARGWFCLALSGVNLVIAFVFATHASWWCVASLFLSFMLWLGVYDPKNLKLTDDNEQSNK